MTLCSECGGNGTGHDKIDGPGDVYQDKCDRCDGTGVEPANAPNDAERIAYQWLTSLGGYDPQHYDETPAHESLAALILAAEQRGAERAQARIDGLVSADIRERICPNSICCNADCPNSNVLASMHCAECRAAIAEHARCVALLRESHDVPHYDTRLGWAEWLAARGPKVKP